MKRFTVFNLLGFILLFAAFRIGWSAVQEYRTDLARRDWPETTAAVTFVESWQERVTSGTKGNRRTRYKTFYHVTYTYAVDGVVYTEHLERTQTPYTQNTEIRIKYDPADPETNTVRLEPSLYNLIVPLCFSGLFAVLGWFTSGLWVWRRKKT